jgi:sterol desaturase/sphingolipid hydroxylase (fatty acid hydroxylase superfamily)
VIRTMMIWMLLAGLIGLAEMVDPEEGHRRSIDAGALRTDVGWVVLYTLYVPALGAALAVAASFVGGHSPGRWLVGGAPWGLQLVIVFVISEIAAYWVHRLQHAMPALWRIHAVHHSSEALRWWSAFRSHPLDTAMAHVVPIIAAAACGVAPDALVPYLATVTIVTVLAHADVHIPRTWLRLAIVTPRFHRSHHELGRQGTNFARVLPVCDLIFRTASFGVGTPTFGTTGGVPSQGVCAQLAWGFRADRRPLRARAISES